MGDKKKKKRSVEVTDENVFSSFDDYEPSVTWAVFLYWILPVLVIACTSRFLVDPHAASGIGLAKEPQDALRQQQQQQQHQQVIKTQPPSTMPTAPTATPTIQSTPERPKKKTTPVPTLVAEKPSSYIEAVQGISRRRLNWDETDSSAMGGYTTTDHREKPKSTTTTTSTASSSSNKPKNRDKPVRGASSDPIRNQLLAKIDELRDIHEEDPTDIYKCIDLAEALRLYDVQYHDGGTAQEEAMKSYKKAISLALFKRQKALERGEETASSNLPQEIMWNYPDKSIDGLLCSLHSALGKVYFMSNMFEKAVESYTEALDIEPMYLDAMASRGSSRIILGQYEDAASDFTTVMMNDKEGRFLDVYTGLARILQARESAVPMGWNPIVENLSEMIPALEGQYASLHNNNIGGTRELIAKTLNRLFHVLFLYNDVKTKDTDAAWDYLSRAYEYKMSALPPWNAGFEMQKIATTKQIFSSGFWPEGVGSKTAAPIFIIGFVRSGSTLLERVLDAHPQIVGTGENSVFNGRLDDIRNKIVEASLLGDPMALSNVISSLADGVVDEMKERWEMGFSGDRTDDQPDPKRFADKMLTNYYNVGFIHMLFPNALILHVIREPMDTIFSAYKHEFPQGTLDYTSDFPSLAELYHGYRDLMDHWDRTLPGRVTHVRYEDMVHDMPGVAKKIVEATGMEWDDSILDFHKKKHAVNTLSTTQVRKGVYKDSLQAWKRYESHLGPLLKLIGERTKYDIKTSLAGYKPPEPGVESDDDEEDDVKNE
eukprot:CAMPEP_0116146158 /NCGR_PEP_ID=MMETSP0329-20121206/17012_1 /TAXON_ID=697910 /ORGANISM="Pseudo-nitzschia arenysensis, Strain B593" /LENGTH=769 /DNA_ID=CAMNT_0003641881 /DNA_START=115 /DNA_END=2421 /DNA_ORIENTATION=+